MNPIPIKNYTIPLWDESELLPFTVGALLYTPATSKKIASGIMEKKYGTGYSLALCLEDSIGELAVNTAEEQIQNTMETLYNETNKLADDHFYIPKIFIRVREPEQMIKLYQRIEPYSELLSGFIFPKYSIDCAEEYSANLLKINRASSHRLYMMPIIESRDLINPVRRLSLLQELKEQLIHMSPYVLNIRVGGNDFCKEFGIRRHYTHTIYDISAVSMLLGDIISTFSQDFVVSGPVWEYFSSHNDEWKIGLYKELQYDLLNGFIGKTVIHPNQIEIVNYALKVSITDYNDALSILHLDDDFIQVEKSADGFRMNEVKTHRKWAEKILKLSQIYGVKMNESS